MENAVVPIPSRNIVVQLALVDRDPGQPRKDFDPEEIQKLANNFKRTRIVLNPIFIRSHPTVPERWILVAGERRFRALQLLGVPEFRFSVAEADLPHYVISMVENSHRVNLNVIEEAESYREGMDRERMSMAQLSEFTGKPEQELYRVLRYLKLPPEVQQMVRDKKLNRSNVQNLAQFKELGQQIALAKRLLAGENPPEITEVLSENSPKSESVIIARLPKTAEGLIRRMLEFRNRMHSANFAIDAFLKLSGGAQISGWQYFTTATRENLEAEVKRGAELLAQLQECMEALPETKRMVLSGAAASSATAKQEATRAKNGNGRTPILHETAKPSERWMSIRAYGRGQGEKYGDVIRYLLCNPEHHGAVNLGREHLRGVLGLPKTADLEDLVLGALRTAWVSWDIRSQSVEPSFQREFLLKIERIRKSLGDSFPIAINQAWLIDESPDPVDLTNLDAVQ